jgi:hypothetical protein
MTRYRPAVTALLWGLDTGLGFTTYRVSSLTWVAMTSILFGQMPWWSGVMYGLGFVIPLLVVCFVLPIRPELDGFPPNPGAIAMRLGRYRRRVLGTAMTLLLATSSAMVMDLLLRTGS